MKKKKKKEKLLTEQIYKRESIMATVIALAATLLAVLNHCAGMNFLERLD